MQVAVHAMAVKYGGKFVDIFLKATIQILTVFKWLMVGHWMMNISPAFDFLHDHFQEHNDIIIQTVRCILLPTSWQCQIIFISYSFLALIMCCRSESFKRQQELYRPCVLRPRYDFIYATSCLWQISISPSSLEYHYFAKGSKRTMVTRNVPATKRSLERFVFHVKALLHNTSSGCSFWMGRFIIIWT